MGIVKITWVNSITVGVTKHIIYRDDIEIGQVLVADPSEFYDNSPIAGVTHKYEVQSSDSGGTSIDEQVGINVFNLLIPSEPPVQPTGDHPTLSNFKVLDGQPSRVYFDSNMPITASDAVGFTISDKTIVGIQTAGTGQTSSHYFTVSIAFNAWDNNLIEYNLGSNMESEVGGAILHGFTLTEIVNNIVLPTSSGTSYYVTTSGSNGANGESEGTAWAELEYALTQISAGDIVYVKQGDYGRENLDLDIQGTVNNPIRIIGYKTSINDISSNYYDIESDNWSTSEMPSYNGGDRSSNNAAGTSYPSTPTEYVIMENLQFREYSSGLLLYGLTNVILNRVNLKDIGSGYHKAINFIANTTVVNTDYVRADKIYSRILDCNVRNATGEGIFWMASNCLVKDNKVLCNSGATSDEAMDYYLCNRGDNSIAINNWAKRSSTAVVHGGYVGVRSDNSTVDYVKFGNENYYCERNLYTNNNIYGLGRMLKVRNVGSNYNVMKYNYAEGFDTGSSSSDGGGISLFGGVKYNVWENNYILGVTKAIRIYNNVESDQDNKVTEGNIIRNNIFKDCYYGTYAESEDYSYALDFNNNSFYNNTFYNIEYQNRLINTKGNINYSGNEYKNNIFSNVGLFTNTSSGDTITDSMFTFDYCDFHSVSGAPSGSNNVTTNPNFVDTTDFVPQVTLDGTQLTGVEYDYNGKERLALPQMGAVEI